MKKQAIDDSNVLCAIKRQMKKQSINDLNVPCGKVTNEQRATDECPSKWRNRTYMTRMSLQMKKHTIDDWNIPCGMVKITNGETGHRRLKCPLLDNQSDKWRNRPSTVRWPEQQREITPFYLYTHLSIFTYLRSHHSISPPIYLYLPIWDHTILSIHPSVYINLFIAA